MTPGAISKLDRWAATPGFRDLTIDDAAAQLQDLAPQYPPSRRQPCRDLRQRLQVVWHRDGGRG